jgi:hypothetical protein
MLLHVYLTEINHAGEKCLKQEQEIKHTYVLNKANFCHRLYTMIYIQLLVYMIYCQFVAYASRYGLKAA